MNFKKSTILLLMIILLMSILTGCIDQDEVDYEHTLQNGGAYHAEINNELENDNTNDNVDKIEDSKLNEMEKVDDSNNEIKDSKTNEIKEDVIKSTSKDNIISLFEIEMESMKFQEDLEFIEDKVHELGGHISSHELKSNVESNDKYLKTNIAFRVPQDEAQKLIKEIKEKFFVISESSHSIDITEEVYNIEANIESLSNQEERLNELYDRTVEINEVLEIESKISEINKERNQLMRKLTSIKDKFNYSRINLTIYEVKKLTSDKNSSLVVNITQILIVLAFGSMVYFKLVKPTIEANEKLKVTKKKDE